VGVSREDTLNHRSRGISEFVQDDLETMWGDGVGENDQIFGIPVIRVLLVS